RLPVTGCRLPVAGCRLPVTSCRLPVTGCQLPVAGYRLRVTGYWLLVTGECSPVNRLARRVYTRYTAPRGGTGPLQWRDGGPPAGAGRGCRNTARPRAQTAWPLAR